MCLVYGLTTQGYRVAPKSFTFADVFMMSCLLSIYLSFSLQNLMGLTPPTIAGNRRVNGLVFISWLSLLAFMVTYWLLRIVIGVGKTISYTAGVLVFAGTSLVTFDFETFFKVVMADGNPGLITQMAVTLAVSLPLLYSQRPTSEGGMIPKVILRKLFHILAFFLFAPVHMKMNK